jgi:hypothetical protein
MGGPAAGLGNQLGGLGEGCGVRHDSVQGDHRDTFPSLPIVQAWSIPFHASPVVLNFRSESVSGQIVTVMPASACATAPVRRAGERRSACRMIRAFDTSVAVPAAPI